MKLNKIHHIAIICSDYEKSKDFYVNVLGFEVLRETYREDRDSYKLDLMLDGEYQLELFSFPNRPERPSDPGALGLGHLAVGGGDCEDAIDELEKKGIEVEEIRVDPYTNKRFTFFQDPDKQPLELYEK